MVGELFRQRQQIWAASFGQVSGFDRHWFLIGQAQAFQHDHVLADFDLQCPRDVRRGRDPFGLQYARAGPFAARLHVLRKPGQLRQLLLDAGRSDKSATSLRADQAALHDQRR